MTWRTRWSAASSRLWRWVTSARLTGWRHSYTPADLLSRLERAEVTRVGRAMAAERGLAFKEAKTGDYVSGRLIGSTQLASGRFAMIDDGLGFSLVPWQPVLDKRLDQHITGVMRDSGVDWSFGRKRGLGL